MVGDRVSLANELIQALARYDASSICITIRPVACSRRRSVDRDLEVNRTSGRPRSEHKMKIPCMKAVDDCSIRLVQQSVLARDRPVSRQTPLIKIGLASCVDDATSCTAPPGETKFSARL